MWRATEETLSREALHSEMSRLLQTNLHRLSEGNPGNISSRLVSPQHFLVCQDFYGEEYQSHTSCMSEDQRYSKEGRGGWDPSKGQVSNAETGEMVKMVNMTFCTFRDTRERINRTPGSTT